jgi:hypothetical protein
MQMNSRKIFKPILEIAALVVIAVNLVLGVGLVWLSSRVGAERDSYSNLRSQVAAQEILVKRLRGTIATLPVTEGQVKLFLEDHVPSRREGFSRATQLIWSLKDEAGVQLEGVSYKPTKTAVDEPLQPLGAEITLGGTFSNLISFAHSLETADDFVVVRGLNFAPGEGGKLNLHLSADFYISP